jgi:hypothetical protein
MRFYVLSVIGPKNEICDPALDIFQDDNTHLLHKNILFTLALNECIIEIFVEYKGNKLLAHAPGASFF